MRADALWGTRWGNRWHPHLLRLPPSVTGSAVPPTASAHSITPHDASSRSPHMLLAHGALLPHAPTVVARPAITGTISPCPRIERPKVHRQRLLQPLLMVATSAISSGAEPSLTAVFAEAVETRNQASTNQSTRAHWANKFRPLGYLACFVAASYSIVPLMLCLHLAMYVAWFVVTTTQLIRLAAINVRRRQQGLSMEVADSFAAEYCDAVACGDVEPRGAPPDISTMQAQVRESIEDDEA